MGYDLRSLTTIAKTLRQGSEFGGSFLCQLVTGLIRLQLLGPTERPFENLKLPGITQLV